MTKRPMITYPTRKVLGVIDDPAQARSMAVDVEHPVLGPIRQAGLAFDLAGTPASIRTAPPLLGEHAREILAGLGFDEAGIAALAAAGTI